MSQPAWPHYILFDSDSNPIAAYPLNDMDSATNLGCAIVAHYALIDRVKLENAALGIGPADEHITVIRALLEPDNEWYGYRADMQERA